MPALIIALFCNPICWGALRAKVADCSGWAASLLLAGAVVLSSGSLLAVEINGGEFRVDTIGGFERPAVAANAHGDFVVAYFSAQDASGGISVQRFSVLGIAQGAETLVNTFTTGVQRFPAVAMDANGGFVVAWTSAAQDGSGDGIYAQRFNAAGVAQGMEFRVNTFTTGAQTSSAVALDADGDFVVVWTSAAQDGSGDGIYAQRYNAAGVAQGMEFRVNTFTTGAQSNAAVAMDSDGDFVITWTSNGQDGGGDGVYAQLYNAAGVAQGAEFRVNTIVAGAQSNSSVAMDSAGDFVVAWTSNGQDGDGDGVYAQRYNAAGAAQGAEFKVNTYTTSDQANPAVTLDADGDFVVTWQSSGQDGGNLGIFAQRYNAAGAAQAAEFQVNTYTMGDQQTPAVALDADGDFVIAWVDTANGIFAQRYGPAVSQIGPQFIVNNPALGGLRPDVARDNAGNTVVVWQSNGPDGDMEGIFARRYNAAGVAQGAEFQVNTYTTSIQSLPKVAMDVDGDFVVVWQSFGQDGSGYGVYAQRFNAAGVAQGTEFQVDTVTANNQQFPHVAMDAAGNFIIAWDRENSQGVYARLYNATGVPQAVPFRVNTLDTGRTFSLLDVGMAANGDWVVVWEDIGHDGALSPGVYAKASAVTGDFRVNDTVAGNENTPVLAMGANGGFVISWTTNFPGPGFLVYAKRYNAAGVSAGEFQVNTMQNSPTDVAIAPSGDFVIMTDSKAQRYSRETSFPPTALGAEFTGGDAVAMNAAGDFVVVFDDGSNVYMRYYAPNHAPRDIVLSNASVAENTATNTAIGTLSAADADVGDAFTYAFVAGAGDTDNAAFQISGGELRTNAALNFETKSAYSVRIRGTDYNGLTVDKVFAISVTNVNEAPTDIAVSSASVAENTAANTAIGTLSATDVDAGDTFTYTFVAGVGDTDNAAFQIAGNELRTLAALDFETKSAYSVRIRGTDAGTLNFEKAFTLSVTNANEAPAITSGPAAAPNPATTGQIVTFNAGATDPDGDTPSYAWTFGDGANGSGASVMHTYSAAGTYNVTLTVTDGNGGSVNAGVSVVVTAASGPLDTDGDGIPNATDPDDDNDGFNDDAETAAGTNPLDPNSKPGGTGDNDSDGTPDDQDTDDDNDGVSDSDEIAAGTSPVNPVSNPLPTGDIDGDGTPNDTDTDDDGDSFSDELEAALNSSPMNAGSTPFNLAAVTTPKPLNIAKLAIKLDFVKPAADSLAFSGILPVEAGFTALDQNVVVDVGGAIAVFKLSAKGASPKGNNSFSIKLKAAKGVVPQQDAKYTVRFSKGDFDAKFADEQLTKARADAPIANASRMVTVNVIFAGSLFQKLQPQIYGAKKNTGSTK